MNNIDIYVRIIIDFIALIAFLWTIWQEFRLHKRVKYTEILNQEDLDDINDLFDKLQGDIKELKARTNMTRTEIFDYVDQSLTPIARRLSTRFSREKSKQAEEDQIPKRSGIIPMPSRRDNNGTTS